MAKTIKAGGSEPPTTAEIVQALQALNQFTPGGTDSTPAPDSAGAHLMPISTVRKEKLFVLFESQFDNIVRFNKASVVCFNTASIVLSVFLGAILGYIYSARTDAEAKATIILCIVSGLLALVLIIFGIIYFWQQKTDAQNIKDATEEKDVDLTI